SSCGEWTRSADQGPWAKESRAEPRSRSTSPAALSGAPFSIRPPSKFVECPKLSIWLLWERHRGCSGFSDGIPVRRSPKLSEEHGWERWPPPSSRNTR
ncbi:unnamed protein product, partial [Laminaria digitata]